VARTGRRENMAETPPGRRPQFEYGREQYPPERYPPVGYPRDSYPQNGYPRDPYGQEPYPGQEQYPREQYDYTREQAPPGREQFEYARTSPGRKPKQRRRRKGLMVLLALVVLLGAGAAAGVVLGVVPQQVPFIGSAPKPVGLVDAPGAPAGAGATAEGNWNIVRGNTTFVGYRVREKLANLPAVSDAVGRTPAVTGGMSIFGGKVVGAQINADLRQLASNQGRRDEVIRGRGLETNRFPQAAFQLTQPVNLGQPPLGKVVTLNAVGTMTLHGVTRQVQLPMQGRWDGNTLQVAGRFTIRFADYRIQAPSVAGFVQVQPQGQVELSLVMARS
jgi:polyisoprenoid-binding protein YceI